MRISTLVLLCVSLLCSLPVQSSTVWVVDLEGAVGPASADLVIRAIEDAGEEGAEALVIRMDTPGGLDKSMRDLVKAILAARIPVVTYVSPDGARAASAGTYIAFASHVAAMAPATNIGSSTPVSISPSPLPPTMPKPQPEMKPETKPDEQSGDEKIRPDVEDDAMTKKIVNDAVAYLQGLAELRGRNIEWAEQTVREGANLRASDALEQNVIDLVSEDLPALLSALHGREVKVGSAMHTFDTKDAQIHRVTPDWRHDLLSIITDPSIAYGLLIIGIYGLILEFYNPGTLFAGILGTICLLLGAYGLQMLPINYAGLALLLLGIGLLVAEVLTPNVGILGIGGVISFVMGSVLLIDSELPGYQIPMPMIAAFAAAGAGICFFVVGAAVRMRAKRPITGKESMIGAPAIALEDFSGAGDVRAFGEVWRAHSAAPVNKDDRLVVTAIHDLVLEVEPEK